MNCSKIIFLGDAQVGKTQLVNGILKKSPFNPEYKATIAVEFTTIEKLNIDLSLWDTMGDEKYKLKNPGYLRGAEIAVYCVDLSKPINLDLIKTEMEQFKEDSPDAIFILVGTKSDLCPDDSRQKLDSINIDGVTIVERMVTSAKDNIGIEELVNQLMIQSRKILNVKDSVPESVWEEAKKKLLNSLVELPMDTKRNIRQEVDFLIHRLSNPGDLQPLEIIDQFSEKCEGFLKSKYSNVLKAVFVVAAAATVTILAGLTGFGIGFALGLWSGPGAFISGLVAGQAAAAGVVVAAGTLGLATAGLTSFGVFCKSKETDAVRDFVKEIKEEIKDEIKPK